MWSPYSNRDELPLADNPSNDLLRIMVIEDEPIAGRIYQYILNPRFDVTLATGAQEGWALYVQKTPHIVFLDIGLPDGSGNDLARRIKLLDPYVFVVMATASKEMADKKEAVINHTDGYLTKPLSAEKINRFIQLYQSRQLH